MWMKTLIREQKKFHNALASLSLILYWINVHNASSWHLQFLHKFSYEWCGNYKAVFRPKTNFHNSLSIVEKSTKKRENFYPDNSFPSAWLSSHARLSSSVSHHLSSSSYSSHHGVPASALSESEAPPVPSNRRSHHLVVALHSVLKTVKTAAITKIFQRAIVFSKSVILFF